MCVDSQEARQPKVQEKSMKAAKENKINKLQGLEPLHLAS